MKFLLLAAVFVAAAPAIQAGRVVCYFANWAVYKPDALKANKVDPNLCTHIVYSFIGLTQEGFVTSLDPWNDIGDEWTEGGFKKFIKLRQINPAVKLLIGIGGWNEGPTRFQGMVRNPEKRKNFLESSLNFLKQYKFDGIDISWMYQDSWGGTTEDKAGYSALVREMKPRYEEKGFLLTISTSANFQIIENSYDIPALSKYVDFINLISYDLHGSWDKKTGHVAPLYPMSSESESERANNVAAVVNRYLERGAPAGKINVGLIAYGRTFTLLDSNNIGFNSPSTGPGKTEPLPYNVFCAQDLRGVWKKMRNTEQAVPYAVAGNQWVGYEDTQSLIAKVNFVKSKKLGGVTFWTLDNDDYNGVCNSGKFPLLKAVKEAMSKN